MKFLTIETLAGDRDVAHGFGVRRAGEEKPVRNDWSGKRVTSEGESFPLFSLRQVHGDRIRTIGGTTREPEEIWQEEGDCLITGKAGIALGVFTADCLPILLHDPERRAVAVVHAGWRGTAAGIARKAVERMASEFFCRPSRIRAALGPCIGPCCYEVDEPVKKAFEERGIPWPSVSQARGKGKWSLDLALGNSLLLQAAGLPQKNMEIIKLCTSCRPDLFYSYRRGDRDRGRHLNFIALRAKPGGREEVCCGVRESGPKPSPKIP